jgi:hypothetical protein
MVSKINAERLAAGLLGMALASAGMAQDTDLSPGQTGWPLGGSLSAGPLVQISGKSPFGALDSCGNFPGTVGTPGSNFLNSEIEPWVDVNPAYPGNIVAYWQQDRWSNGGARSLVAGVSLDGGSTWETIVVPGLTDCSGGKFERASDPWLSFSPDGTLHQISLSFNIDPPSNLPALFGPNALLVSKSNDGGLTWSDPITIIEDSDPHFLNDKESITADPEDSNLVYATWDRLQNLDDLGTSFKGPALFTRTTNGGDTWEKPRAIFDPGVDNQVIGAQIVVTPDGRLLDFFNEIINVRPDGTLNRLPKNLSLVSSSDKGVTWSAESTRANRILSVGTVTPNLGAPVRDAANLFDVAVDSRNGKLYAVWQDARFSGFEFDSIAFSMSDDGGQSWSRPIKVNKTPRGLPPLRQQAFVPSVAVTEDGTVVVTYYDFRNDDNGPSELVDYFAVSCRGSCNFPLFWSREVQLTNKSFDLLQAPFAGGLFLGDYMGLAGARKNALPVFGQTISDEDPTSLFFRRIDTGD